MKYIVYDKFSGDILRTGQVSSPADLPLQASNFGEEVIEGSATDLDHCVDLGTKRVLPDPARRAAHTQAIEARAAAREAKRVATVVKLEAIINNPTTNPAIRTLAELQLETL